MITCRINGKKLAVDARGKEKLFCMEVSVSGTGDSEIEIGVEGMYPYSVKYVPDGEKGELSFSVEVVLPLLEEKLVLLIKKDGRMKKKKVKAKGVKIEQWTLDKSILLCMMSGNVERKVFYGMDEAAYLTTRKQWVLKGWFVSAYKDSRICCRTPEGEQELKFYRRRDVESLGILEQPEILTGFSLTCSPGKILHLCIGDREHGYNKIHVPTDRLLSYYHIRIEQIDREEAERRYGEKGITYKEQMVETAFWERQWNNTGYHFEKKEGLLCESKSKLSVIVAVNEKKWIDKIIQDRQSWKHDNIELIFAGKDLPEENLPGGCKSVSGKGGKEELLLQGFRYASGDYVTFLDQEDEMEPEYPGYGSRLLDGDVKAGFVYSDYDFNDKGEYLIKVRRLYDIDAENKELFWTGVIFRRELCRECGSLGAMRDVLLGSRGIYNDEVMLHYACVPDTWGKKKGMPIAFYLPQYHITEENNKWWGEGFTEWTNVKNGKPLYENHHQPRIPGELGYYDLTEDMDMQRRQVALAKEYGIYGFCFYYYWFEGKRLLRKPLDQYLERKNLDLPYCICWANENWTRRWDGQEKDILMQQVHNADTDEAFIREVMPMFRDPRYIRIEGKPVLLIYRFGLFEYPAETIERWRRICREEGIGEIQIAMVQAFKELDNRVYGADFSVEFPPHMTNMMDMEVILGEVGHLHKNFTGHLYSYRKMVERLRTVVKRTYTLYPGCMLEWDNTARRKYNPDIYVDFTPELFRIWLIRNQFYARLYNPEPVTFINAWNEWAEGTYLEPDEKWGRKNLEMVKEVVSLK